MNVICPNMVYDAIRFFFLYCQCSLHVGATPSTRRLSSLGGQNNVELMGTHGRPWLAVGCHENHPLADQMMLIPR